MNCRRPPQLAVINDREELVMHSIVLPQINLSLSGRRREFDADCIVPGYLWLGSARAAENKEALERNGITRRLSLTGTDIFGEEEPLSPCSPSSTRFDLSQLSTDELAVTAEKAVELVYQGRGREPLLIHCSAGVSHAPSLCVNLLERLGLCSSHANSYIRAFRPHSRPEDGMWAPKQPRAAFSPELPVTCDMGAQECVRDLVDRVANGAREGAPCCVLCGNRADCCVAAPSQQAPELPEPLPQPESSLLERSPSPSAQVPKNRPLLRVNVPDVWSQPNWVTPVTRVSEGDRLSEVDFDSPLP
mmetsp:Transcript_47382/g.111542  ORF Transcript_47382/g.111542 Transcript_47382/m.111542 type:complete len:303 (-) Transcript_47382:92-1000(-)